MGYEVVGYTPEGVEVKRANDAPWDTYAAEMDPCLSEELAEAVAEYAEKRWDPTGKVDSQTAEELARRKEDNDNLASQYQWLTPEEYANVEERIGRVMTHSEFINTLRKAGVSCWYQQHPHHDKAILLYSKNGGPREVACWIQQGIMPELSLMNFDAHGVPLAEKRRGWRTCLLQII